jgi:crotonobetainyl-CoA:carnitine CoA-transferase CaiB-like acyl-CoA transferase
MSGPLDDVRILDLTRVVAGPYGTAQVRGLSVTFNDLNRNKEGLCLDLRRERGRELLLELVAHFDVLAENFAAGTLAGWGLGWDVLRAHNPRLVYASLSGFGHDGPYAGLRSYDLVAQAMGGFMAMSGEPEGPPMKTGVNLADYIGGVFLACGILAALRERDACGRGQRLDISNQDLLVTMLDSAVSWFRAGGEEPARSGNFHRVVAPYGAYRARDGWVVVAIGSPKMFARSLEAIGRADLLADPGFLERLQGFVFREEVNALWSDWVARHTRAEVEERCREFGLGFGSVKSIADLAADPQLAQRGMLAEVEHPDGQGSLPTHGAVLRMECTNAAPQRAAPALGQDTERLLAELLGASPEEIERLRREGVV